MSKQHAINRLKVMREYYGKEGEYLSIANVANVVALDVAIKCLENDRNEMIVNDIKRIIKRYDDMNLSASFEERKENHIKAYMEIKDYFNNQAAEDKEE